jgi:hypothetical protein
MAPGDNTGQQQLDNEILTQPVPRQGLMSLF